MSSNQPLVFLVDDDAAIRKALCASLQKRDFSTKDFESSEEFLTEYRGESGCLVLDLGMPGMTGLELQIELRQREWYIPVIIITGSGNVPQSVAAFKSGAIDFLEKPFQMDDLTTRIDDAFEQDRKIRKHRELKAEALSRLNPLTEREREVLQVIVATHGNLSSKEIAREMNISHRTVDQHKASIMKKSGAGSTAELIELIVRAGLEDVPDA